MSENGHVLRSIRSLECERYLGKIQCHDGAYRLAGGACVLILSGFRQVNFSISLLNFSTERSIDFCIETSQSKKEFILFSFNLAFA